MRSGSGRLGASLTLFICIAELKHLNFTYLHSSRKPASAHCSVIGGNRMNRLAIVFGVDKPQSLLNCYQ